jgi:hypothetical protein
MDQLDQKAMERGKDRSIWVNEKYLALSSNRL